MNQIQTNVTYHKRDWFPNDEMITIFQMHVTEGIAITDLPASMEVDYVKVKQFFLAPEITINNSSCLTSTATMDVASEAYSVTWQLTPPSLFNTLNGTGKVANISKKSGTQGLGKITYTFRMPSAAQPLYETFTAEKDIWVGIPTTPTNIVGFYEGQVFGLGSEPSFSISTDPLHSLTNIEWVATGGTITSGQGTNRISVLTNSTAGVFKVKVRLTNACGTTTYFGRNGTLSEEGPVLLISPNPATSKTTIEIVSANEQTLATDASWDLEIYDSMQSLKTKNQKIKGNKRTINTTGWREGVYLVRVKLGNEILSGKLMVKP